MDDEDEKPLEFDEAIAKMNAIYAREGKDYVITWDNHPEIMKAWHAAAIADIVIDDAKRRAKEGGGIGERPESGEG